MSTPVKLLVASNDRNCVEKLRQHPAGRNFRATFASHPDAARNVLQSNDMDIAVLDPEELGVDGKRLIRELRDNYPFLVIIVVLGAGAVNSAVRYMKAGCFACLERTCSVQDFWDTMEQAYAERKRRELEWEREKLDEILRAATFESPRGILKKVKELRARKQKRILQ